MSQTIVSENKLSDNLHSKHVKAKKQHQQQEDLKIAAGFARVLLELDMQFWVEDLKLVDGLCQLRQNHTRQRTPLSEGSVLLLQQDSRSAWESKLLELICNRIWVYLDDLGLLYRDQFWILNDHDACDQIFSSLQPNLYRFAARVADYLSVHEPHYLELD